MPTTPVDPQYEPGKDTRPLLAAQLSAAEVAIIKEIERRLEEVHRAATAKSRKRDTRVDYFARAEQRDRRILLLDGGRGTGKTSMLVTLVRRWNPPPCDEYDATLGSAPDFVRVLPILDFDPLPPGMPLPAWIVQAWRPLVNYFDETVRNAGGLDESEGPLVDEWHKLFRLAAVGWSSIPLGAGLLEQVLDREEQVEGWHHLHQRWYDFVESVLVYNSEQVPKQAQFLPAKPVFVIMIDDVDLQVKRAAELLPALRLLHHPSVVFMVAADRGHLNDMLRLDFFGRQRELASYANAESDGLWTAVKRDPWCKRLAASAFEKVFSSRDQWTLEWLSLAEFLEFPGSSPRTFREVLNERGKPSRAVAGWSDTHRDELLGQYVKTFATVLEDLTIETSIMTYRTAQQLADEVFTRASGVARATMLLHRLFNSKGDEAAVILPEPVHPQIVEYRPSGEVAAVFSPDLLEAVFPERQTIVLSGSPRFTFIPDGGALSTESGGSHFPLLELLAISLQDTHRGVSAPRLRWEARQALAWTQWRIDELPDMSFRWLLHILPPPLTLLEWSKEWATFIREIAKEAFLKRDRIAYGWIYHQLSWLGAALRGVAAPKKAILEDEKTWTRLLERDPRPDDPSLGLAADRWRRRTLPLLARPELGLSPEVQILLISRMPSDAFAAELVSERRRLVRDAFDAAAIQRGSRAGARAEKEEADVDRVLSAINDQYPESPWRKAFGQIESDRVS